MEDQSWAVLYLVGRSNWISGTFVMLYDKAGGIVGVLEQTTTTVYPWHQVRRLTKTAPED